MATRSKDAPKTQDSAGSINIRPLDSLAVYVRNARTHDDAQIAQLMGSIIEFGFTNPVLADGDGIVAGHGRCMAARKLYEQGKTIKLPNGQELPAGTVPVVDVSGWSEAKRRAYIIADNRLPENAGWDYEMLAVELDELRDMDFDLAITGFNQKELDDLIGTAKVPAAPGSHVDLNAGGDNSRSGVFIDSLKFGNNEVNVTPEEIQTLENLLKGYLDEFGMSYGFVAWLCEGRSNA